MAAGRLRCPRGTSSPPRSNGYLSSSAPSSARPNANFGAILRISSDVNFSLLSNYTWAHALDYNPYVGTGVPTFNVYDPNNLREEYGNSSLNVPNRFVFAAVYEPGVDHSWGSGLRNDFKREALGGWRLAPIVLAQNGLPYTPTVSGSPTDLVVPAGALGCVPAAGATTCPLTESYKGINGSGSSANRVVVLGRNQFQMPRTATVDFRLAKTLPSMRPIWSAPAWNS